MAETTTSILLNEQPAASAAPLSKVGAVLVAGGGVSGIQASLDLAGMGFKVYLVDESPSIGGRMAQLDKTFPTNDCSMCILSPKLIDCARNPNIEIITRARVDEVRGQAGN
ncbi:MAG: FAD-dependent oxidoreductase, partial [Dehalococcoidia bacterium]